MNARVLMSLALLLAGCKTATPAATVRPSPVVAPSKAPVITPVQPGGTAPLVHDGGIVFGPRLTPIADAGKRESAGRLGAALTMSLLTDRSMRDAELLAGRPAARYAVLADEADGLDEGAWADAISTSAVLEGVLGPNGLADLQALERAGQEALADWERLADGEQSRIEALVLAREAKLLAVLDASLKRKLSSFLRQGEDRVQAITGGQEITTTYAVDNGTGRRTVTTTRTLDREGTLIQAVTLLKGTLDGVEVDARRVRTVKPDGSVETESETRYRLDGQPEVVRWARRVDTTGILTARGTFKRADGRELALTGSGSEEGLEAYQALDGDVRVELRAEAAAERGTAIFRAGEQESVTLEVDGNADLDDR